MLMTLFLKECRLMVKCLTYYVVIICILFMYTTQIGSEGVIKKPKPGQKDYGYMMSDDKSVIMDKTLSIFSREYYNNVYSTYPFAFEKKITLNDKKQSQMGDILAEATGKDRKEVDALLKEYFSDGESSLNITKKTDEKKQDVLQNTTRIKETYETLPNAAKGLSYRQFIELMTRADKILGGGSSYTKDNLQGNAYVPMTYEQAMAEYHDIIKKDHLSGAYARVFCDYLGIVLAILPIFLIVTRCLRDRRARANEIIYSRKASSFQIILSRYLATVVMLLLPILILAFFQTVDCIYAGWKEGIVIDYFAYYKYIAVWLLPTLLVVISVGAFLTELTESAIAIIIQGLWWIISVMSGKLVGNSGWNLIPRHNNLGKYDLFMKNFSQFAINRISYTIAAVILISATVYVYELKRKGIVNLHGKIFSNRKIKYEA